MNVLIINHEFPPIGGGGGVFSKLLANGLAESGIRTYILTIGKCSSIERITANLTIIRIRVSRNSSTTIGDIESFKFIIAASLKIREIIKKFDIDIVNPHFIHTSGLANYISFNKCPAVISALGADVYDPTRYLKIRKIMDIAARRIIDKSGAFVVSSSDMRARALKLLQSDSYPVEIIPHCIDYARFAVVKDSTLKLGFGFNSDTKILISVCRLVKRKNLELAIDIFNELYKTGCNIGYFIIGAGPEKKMCVNKIEKYGLTERIKLLDYVEDSELPMFYANSDIFLLPSHHEAFGIAALEAMAAGLVPVCSNIGGWSDFIVNDKTGFLCANMNEYTDKLKILLDNDTIYNKLSDNSRITAETYDYKNIAGQYARLYDKALT